MKAYKLLRKMTNGALKPLFIGKTKETKIGEWLQAECIPTKGFAVRQGWHCCLKPEAPHLTTNPKNGASRVWCEVEVNDFVEFERPESQGGKWVLAQQMKVIREL